MQKLYRSALNFCIQHHRKYKKKFINSVFFYLMIKMRFRPMAKILCADNSAAVCQQKHFSQDEECLEVN